MQADIGVIGLGVMGKNITLNLIDHNYNVAVYDTSELKIDETYQSTDVLNRISPTYSLHELLSQLTRPRIILLLVPAGSVVTNIIDEMIGLVDEGDIIIDGGNSHYKDTEERFKQLKTLGIHFIGMGISGGERGARYGPSLMPGGEKEAWDLIKPIFQSIAAKVDKYPCCQWMGSGGAGHFVKTIHNGIEYSDMQLIAEIYAIMRNGMHYSISDIQSTFESWNNSKLQSYLTEITASILKKIDPKTDQHIIDVILDSAGQKGTGKWTVTAAMEYAQPITMISAAVMQRFLSSQKSQRVSASNAMKLSDLPSDIVIGKDDLRDALLLGRMITLAQGFSFLKDASSDQNWQLDLETIASVWRNGCIIRSALLDDIMLAFKGKADLENLLLTPYFTQHMKENHHKLRSVIKFSVDQKISTPCLSNALAYLDAYTSEVLPANLIQAQRDYFGSHGYYRVDDTSETKYHTDWD